MRRKKTKKSGLVAVLLILILLISVGYAALSTTLQINGTANISVTRWNVHFTNIVPDTDNNNVKNIDKEPELSNSDTIVTWEVSMDTPGQVYQFNVDVINEGTIDAMVSTETNNIISALTADQQKYLDYTVTYVNGAEIEQYDKLAVGETKTLTVRLAYKSSSELNASDLPTTDQEVSLSYTTNYVQADGNAVEKVTEIASLEIGDSVAYTTTLNGQTLSDWSVFYVDGDYTYLILDDYLPTAYISTSIKTTHNLNTRETYGIYANNSREDLVSAMSTKENWDSLLTGTINGHAVNETRTANVWAMGAPTLDLWVNSWNATYPSDTLYTRYVDTEDIDEYHFHATGYAIADTTDPTATYLDLSSKTGFNNTLYFPHQEIIDNDNCVGYWLASPCAYYVGGMMYVYYNGGVSTNEYGYNYYGFAFRPVVCLPSSVVNQ